jgi:nucleotide-binding universal stress UspA family protein/quercetin dioxygenase-like cupin family protein
MTSIQTILHPTDFSDNSRPAFGTACTLARDYGAHLVLLHVMPPSVAPLLPEPPPDPLRSAESQDSLKGRFAWPVPSDPKIQVDHRVAEGDAATEILYLAGALKCDLIVMGSHGRTGLSRLLTGSVAEEVFRKAPCPVLLVKNPLAEAPAAEAESVQPGEVVDVRPLGAALGWAKTKVLVRAEGLEVVRMVVPAGKEIPQHKTKGILVVQCLEGHVVFTTCGIMQDLRAGDFLYLPAEEPHSVKGVRDASLLLTLCRGTAPASSKSEKRLASFSPEEIGR